MKALVLNGKVVQVEQQAFEVHPSLVWVDCPDNVVAGWSYENGQFIEPEPIVYITPQEQTEGA
jgi:hypothetical protein